MFVSGRYRLSSPIRPKVVQTWLGLSSWEQVSQEFTVFRQTSHSPMRLLIFTLNKLLLPRLSCRVTSGLSRVLRWPLQRRTSLFTSTVLWFPVRHLKTFLQSAPQSPVRLSEQPKDSPSDLHLSVCLSVYMCLKAEQINKWMKTTSSVVSFCVCDTCSQIMTVVFDSLLLLLSRCTPTTEPSAGQGAGLAPARTHKRLPVPPEVTEETTAKE